MREFEPPPGGKNLNKVQRDALVKTHKLALPQMNLPPLTEMLRFYNERLTGFIELKDDFFGVSTTLEEFQKAQQEPSLREYTVVVNNEDAQKQNWALEHPPADLQDAIYLVKDVKCKEGGEVDKRWYPILIRGLDPANCLEHQKEAQTFKRLKEALAPPASLTVATPSP